MRKRLAEWFAKAGRDLPWRRNRDPYAVMVSEIMLQQTQVSTVIDYFHRWMERFPNVSALAKAPEEEVLHAWQGLGYYSRARNLHRATKQVVELHEGEIPPDLEALRKLPGLGRYTAGAVATFAFDLPTPIVDANIARVLARVWNLQLPVDSVPGQKALWEIAEGFQPGADGTGKKAKDGRDGRNPAHHSPRIVNEALMELGALVCLPRQPRCGDCPVRDFCRAENPEALPVKKAAAKTVEMREECAWVFDKGQVLLELQTGSRWRGLWKLPLCGTVPKGPKRARPLLRMTYPFTNHRVKLSVYEMEAPADLGPDRRWFTRGDLESVGMTAPHRRALEGLWAMESLPPRSS